MPIDECLWYFDESKLLKKSYWHYSIFTSIGQKAEFLHLLEQGGLNMCYFTIGQFFVRTHK